MKVKFVCIRCEVENEFETEGATKILTEAKREGPEVYLINCANCGHLNRIEVED